MDIKSIIIRVDQRLYSKEAIISVLYDNSEKFDSEQVIDSNDENIIVISLTPKNELMPEFDSVETVKSSLFRQLIDQQLRLHINQQFGHIRDLIVEEAFKPITKQ